MNTVNQPAYKKCPKCQTVAAIDAPVCAACGHQFRTQFTQPVGQVPPQPTQPTQSMYTGAGPGVPTYQAPSAVNPGMVGLTPTSHSPVIALLLALFFPCLPGIATVYNRQYAKAAVYLLLLGGSCFLYASTISAAFAALIKLVQETPKDVDPPMDRLQGSFDGVGQFIQVLSFIPPILFVIYAFDSFMIARKLSEGRPIRQWEYF